MIFDDGNQQDTEPYHRPVLLDAVLYWILTDPAGVYVDGTAGGGGHGEAILRRLNTDGRLVLIDRDEDAIACCRKRFSAFEQQVQVVHGDFRDSDSILSHLNISSITGLFLDLGLSSHQIDIPERGFSYSSDSFMDMRMDKRLLRNAAEILNTYSEGELADLFFHYGEERKSRQIARWVVRGREERPFDSFESLNRIIRKVVGPRWSLKSIARINQALRIEVNDELNQLKEGLQKIYPLIRTSGRIVTIGYHSLEDRIVKQYFRGDPDMLPRDGFKQAHPRFLFRQLTKKVVRPSSEEIISNPRARSAKLRAAEKVGELTRFLSPLTG